MVKERARHCVLYDSSSDPPLTFAFQTRKGTLGLLQVIRYTEEPHGVRIRYKLAQPPAAPEPLRRRPCRKCPSAGRWFAT